MQAHAPRQRRTRALARVLLMASLVACQGCDEAPRRPRFVLLYATCSLGTEFLSPYREPSSDLADFTPSLSAMAERGLVFERHRTESGQSGIAYASLFSGSQAPHHGIYLHPRRIAEEVQLITELFEESGWESHAWLSHSMASASLGYAQGVPPERSHEEFLYARQPDFLALLDRLQAEPGLRALAVTSFSVTHGVYSDAHLDRFCSAYPAECGVRRDRLGFARWVKLYHEHAPSLSMDFPATAERLELGPEEVAGLAATIELLYKSCVFYLDTIFGEVLMELSERGLLEDTLVVFTSDHGEIMFRDNAYFHWTHGFQLAPEVLTVPLLMMGPGVPVGRHAAVTRSIDVMPTLAALAGVAAPTLSGPVETVGIDLSGRLGSGAQGPPALSHTALFYDDLWSHVRQFGQLAALHRGNDPYTMWIALREGDIEHQLRREKNGTWRHWVFDMAADPEQRRDLFDAQLHRRAGDALAAYKQRLVDGFAPRPPEGGEAELLRAMGYIR